MPFPIATPPIGPLPIKFDGVDLSFEMWLTITVDPTFPPPRVGRWAVLFWLGGEDASTNGEVTPMKCQFDRETGEVYGALDTSRGDYRTGTYSGKFTSNTYGSGTLVTTFSDPSNKTMTEYWTAQPAPT